MDRALIAANEALKKFLNECSDDSTLIYADNMELSPSNKTEFIESVINTLIVSGGATLGVTRYDGPDYLTYTFEIKVGERLKIYMEGRSFDFEQYSDYQESHMSETKRSVLEAECYSDYGDYDFEKLAELLETVRTACAFGMK